jgi:hypothetical protein
MQKNLITLISIFLFWACDERLETKPVCNPKAILLEKHLLGSWNAVVSMDDFVGIKTRIEFNSDLSFNAKQELFDSDYL